MPQAFLKTRTVASDANSMQFSPKVVSVHYCCPKSTFSKDALMLELGFQERTDPGRTRDHNEDFLGHVLPQPATSAQDHGWLFALADGVGGQDKGEVASRVAVETALSEFRKIPKGVMHVSLLPKLVQEANRAVFDAGTVDGRGSAAESRGSAETPGNAARMATTLVLCALRFDSAVISHVGDSRCYLFRAGKLTALTHDHTMEAEQIRMGILSKEAGAVASNRHILTRSLGTEMFVAADTITVSVIPGDLLLLCSDGLHGYVPDPAIQQILTSAEGLDEAAEALIAAANQAGGHDNVSVQLIRIKAVERMGLYRGRPYRLL